MPKVRNAADVTIVGLMVSLNRMEVGKGGKKCALDEIKDLYGYDTFFFFFFFCFWNSDPYSILFFLFCFPPFK